MSQKILLADDSITIQKVIELTFSDEDFDVVTVGNGRLALEKLPEVRPDIVLCDIIMPEKDGYEVCEQIKASSAFSHVPVLLLTGAFEPFDQERASQVGSDGFLAKPFEPETLIAKVKDLLRRAGVPADGGGTAAAAPARTPPVVEMVAPQPALSEPSASSPGFIPDEPFEPIDARDFEEAPSMAAAEAPLAAVTAEESATLAGEVPAGESHADSSSTVMFKAGDLPWTGGSQEYPAPPVEPEAPPVPFAPPPAATETTEPEPVFTPEPVEGTDLADAAGAAFEEVLEEDMAFGGGLSAESPGPSAEVDAAEDTPSGSALADSPATQTQAPTVPVVGTRDESPTLKVAVPVMPGDAGHSESPPAEPVETFAPLAPSAPEPPQVFAPEPPAAVEPERDPVETFEPVAPVAPEPPQVFAPEPERQPVETFEPVAEAAPVFAPEPVPEREAPESFESGSPTASERGSMESFEPMPPGTPEPIESFEPMSPTTPEPMETFEPEPPSAPEPSAFEPAAPTPLMTQPDPQSVEAFEPVVREGPAAFERELEAEATFEPAPPPAAGANVVETLPPTSPAEFAADPTPPPALEPEPPSEPVFEPEPEPEPVLEPEPEPQLESLGGAADDLDPVSEGPGVTTLPGVARKDVVESFADLEPGDEPDLAAPSSEAASVPVPVDMVEKIAQRVISQVSEKAVREIAWEVIPDLAEALIKQEIERLKAELQKL